MKHTIRQHVINEYGLPTVKHTTIQGELGSGILDKNGVEIFEGDIVQNTTGRKGVVVFDNGRFYVNFHDNCGEQDMTRFYSAAYLEVVGHAED